MRSAIIKLIDLVLKFPILFELQQKFFNNYTALRVEYSSIFSTNCELKILDIGCASGICASSIVDLKRYTLVGIDLDKNYVTRAKRSFPNGCFLAMDANNLGFDEKSFDVVMFNSVLHHLGDDTIANSLFEVERVLRDGGRLLVAEPIFSEKRIISNLLLRFDRGKYVRRKDEYRDLLNRFDITHERNFEFRPHQFCSFVAQKKASG